MPDSPDDRVRIARQRGEPLILTVDATLTARAVHRLRSVIAGASLSRPVIIDVTTMTGFDSQGTNQLQALQDELGPDRVLVVGFRQAAARLLGLAESFADSDSVDETMPATGDLPTPGMVFVEIKSGASPQALDIALQSAIARDIAIVVVDLDSVAVASIQNVDAIRSASRAAAVRGHELVLVNVAEELALLLNRVGLAATTYLAATR